VARPKGSKNKNKKTLIAYLDGSGWDYFTEFKKAYHNASPDEQLRFFGKTLPFMFNRQDNTPLIEGDVNVTLQGINNPKELAKIILQDPFVSHENILEGEVIESDGSKRKSDTGTDGDKRELEGSDSGSTTEGTEDNGGEGCSTVSGEGSS
jgi:hypothetical protein